ARLIDGNLVMPAPAGGAGLLHAETGGGDRAFERQIGQGIDLEVVADLINGAAVGDQFILGGKIDAVETGVADGRATDAEVNLAGSGPAQRPHFRTRGGSADDAVIDHDDPLTADEAVDDVQLEVDHPVAVLLAGKDERAPHEPVG